jgi:hypothetical protein
MVVDFPEPFGPRNPVTDSGLDHKIQSIDRELVAVSLAEILYFDH